MDDHNLLCDGCKRSPSNTAPPPEARPSFDSNPSITRLCTRCKAAIVNSSPEAKAKAGASDTTVREGKRPALQSPELGAKQAKRTASPHIRMNGIASGSNNTGFQIVCNNGAVSYNFSDDSDSGASSSSVTGTGSSPGFTSYHKGRGGGGIMYGNTIISGDNNTGFQIGNSAGDWNISFDGPSSPPRSVYSSGNIYSGRNFGIQATNISGLSGNWYFGRGSASKASAADAGSEASAGFEEHRRGMEKHHAEMEKHHQRMDTLHQELDRQRRERDRQQREREAAQRKREGEQRQREAEQRERDRQQRERDGQHRERDKQQRESNGLPNNILFTGSNNLGSNVMVNNGYLTSSFVDNGTGNRTSYTPDTSETGPSTNSHTGTNSVNCFANSINRGFMGNNSGSLTYTHYSNKRARSPTPETEIEDTEDSEGSEEPKNSEGDEDSEHDTSKGWKIRTQNPDDHTSTFIERPSAAKPSTRKPSGPPSSFTNKNATVETDTDTDTETLRSAP